MQGVEWPYDGPDAWIRRDDPARRPALLAVAATLAFWPARRGAPALRLAGLVALLLLYGTAGDRARPRRARAARPRAAAAGRRPGCGCRACRRARRRSAAAVVASVGVLSLPVAAALDGDRAWWDYRAWSWFGKGEVITFDWTHEYGPLDWSRDGRDAAEREVGPPALLEGGDARRLRRPALGPLAAADDNRYGPRWRSRLGIRTALGLQRVQPGLGRADPLHGPLALQQPGGGRRASRCGSTAWAARGRAPTGPRACGDGRALRRATPTRSAPTRPNPTKAQMRGRPDGYCGRADRVHRDPAAQPGRDRDRGPRAPGRRRARARGAGARQRVRAAARRSRERRRRAAPRRAIRQLALRAHVRARAAAHGGPADAPTTPSRASSATCRSNYTYSERVPTRPIPLMGFLFEDKRGYCQQFSGAMALMLRMSGIPARVAAGFSPGLVQQGHPRVPRARPRRALLGGGLVPGHRLGPVRPDARPLAGASRSRARSPRARRRPTPARSQPRAGRGRAGARGGRRRGAGLRRRRQRLARAGAPAARWSLPLAARRARARQPRAPPARARARRARRGPAVASCGARSLRLGWDLPASTTLLGLERRLAASPGPPPQAYAGALRGQPLRPARAGGARAWASAGRAPRAHPRQPPRSAARADRDPAGRAASVSTFRRLLSNRKVGALKPHVHDHKEPARQPPLRPARRPGRAGTRRGPDRHRRDRHG